MKKLLKNTYLLVVAVALTLVACKDAQPKIDDTVLNKVSTERETLTVADAYYHGDVYGTGGGSYKVTLTLLSEGMDFSYDEDNIFSEYSGTGYAFELEFNSESENSIAPGVYKADTMDLNQEYYMCDVLTYNPENTYLTIVNNGSNVKNVLDGNITIDVKVSGDVYTIAITGKNALGLDVKGTYTGTIDFRDIYAYREPTTPQSLTFAVSGVECTADEDNAYYAANYGFTLHTVTIEGENGELASLSITSDAAYIESLVDGDYAAEQGYWDLEHKTASGWVIDPSKDYRKDGDFLGSYVIDAEDVYWISGEVSLTYEDSKVVALSLTASSLNGSEITLSYTKAAE
ncbi:MAG: hypothetical protein ACI30B_08320 [Paludibacteraceae bacterium]